MKILGIDPSLTGTAMAFPDGGTYVVPTKKRRGMERVHFLRGEVEIALLEHQPDLVVLEGYSFGSKGSAITDIAEWGGVLRLLLYESGVEWAVVAPSTLKVFATGDGHADKPQMLQQAWQRLEYAGHNYDEMDALWLREAGMQVYALPGRVSMPKAQVNRLKVVTWPALPSGSPAAILSV